MELYSGFYKAKFKGLFTPLKYNKEAGKYSFAEIKWHLLHIDQISKANDFNLFENKCDDFLFQPTIKAKSKRYFDKNTEIVFENKFTPINGSLLNVLIKNYTLPKGIHAMYINSISKNVVEMHGDIYFQLSNEPIKNGLSIFNSNQVEMSVPHQTFSTSVNGQNQNGTSINLGSFQNTSGNKPVVVSTESRYSYWPFFLKLLSLVSCYFFFYEFKYLILLIGIPWLISSMFRGSKLISRTVFGLLFLFLLLFGLFSMYKKTGDEVVETKDGSIKVSPPVEVDSNNKNKGKDQQSKKEITWYDFIPNQYAVSYTTSIQDFNNTQKVNENYISQVDASSQNEAFEKIYQFLSEEDQDKIDSLISAYKKLAIEKQLNTFQTAEMVCTFVQEIPYCLVHQNSCQEFLKEYHSDFVVNYHKQGKPCLPNVPAGVQSPFEFIHNLKGDCDTRTLYAFTILKSFKIPCSIWVSEVYGHSILGIGLPNSNGFYKEVYGTRHYGIELTAKGYRIGMVAGDQRNPKNWKIALSYNN